MSYRLLYEIIHLVVMLIVFWALISIWRRRAAPGGMALFWMLLAVLEWNFCGFMQVWAMQPQELIFWSKLAYLGSMGGQIGFFAFVLEYTNHQQWLNRRNLSLLFVIPVLTLFFVATNEHHHWIWTGFSPSPDGVSMIYHHGFLYWVVAFYVNGIMLTATWLLLRFVAQARHLYKYQSIGVTLASLFPWAGFVLYLSGKNPFPGLEITAVSFGFTGAILAFILNRLSFLDIIPVARYSLVEKMRDGMVVLDGQNRVVDINPAALTIFEIPPQSRWLGRPAATLLKKFPTVWLALQNPAEAPTECETASPQPRAFDVSISSLHHRSGQLAGKAIILHEITRLKKTEKELQEAKRQLEEKLTQIERLKDNLRDESIHDALTGLFNRRYVEEILENEVTRARRGGYPLAFVVLDIDHFKQINDAYGHSQGDELLRALGTAFRGHFRMGDIPCRYGGDEFLLLMPHSSASDALIRIESFRRVCRDLLQKHQADAPPITFSAGIAAYPAHAAAAQDLFGVADQALYQAKERGRNQTCLPTSP